MNKIKNGAFVLLEVPDPDRHVDYNWWHSSDHIPENMALDGIVVGARWAAPKRYMDSRFIVRPELSGHQYLVCYLMTDPVMEVWRNWVDLGDRMEGLGRNFPFRTVRYAGNCRLLEGYVSKSVTISPEALPFRPQRGVYLLMADAAPGEQRSTARWLDEVHIPAMLDLEGVIGAYWFRSRGAEEQLAWVDTGVDPSNRHIILYYLDGDPLAVTDHISTLSPKHAAHPQALVDLGMDVVLAGAYATIPDPRSYDWRD